MAVGKGCGIYGDGASNSWRSGCSQPIDIAPDSNGQFIVTYSLWVDFLGIPAYRAYVNGIDIWPGAGWQLNTVVWSLLSGNASPHDCVNGICLSQEIFNTPGKYNSLSECQAACGGTPCNGECISTAEIADLQAAANALQNKFCL